MLGEYVKEYISKLTTVGIMHRKGIELKRRDYDELQELLLYSTKELDELIKASEERDTLKARVDELEEEIKLSRISQKLFDQDLNECIDKKNKLKQDALLGKMLNLAIKQRYRVKYNNYKNDFVVWFAVTGREIILSDWYKQQLEKEETSGK